MAMAYESCGEDWPFTARLFINHMNSTSVVSTVYIALSLCCSYSIMHCSITRVQYDIAISKHTHDSHTNSYMNNCIVSRSELIITQT